MNEPSPSREGATQPTLAGTESEPALPTMADLDDLHAQLDSIDRTLADLDDG